MKKEHRKERENEEKKEQANVDSEVLKEDDGLNIETIKQENEALKDELLRAMAESENLKKRCAAEIEKNNRYAISSFAKDLLIVADNLDRAIVVAANENEANNQALLDGIKLTKQELTHVFQKFGITKMQTLGQPFDPNFHQVVQQISDSSKPAGTIVEELQTGYMINGRILREAMVVVSKQ
ncbi:MAG: nucleotide exchange factor GrpE [Alphaproteobacteria bacterium]|nr:nucleotide exchange factor GrpE [Alphaproteobacteria bacterium]